MDPSILFRLTGLIAVLVGVRVLWQARGAFLFWTATFVQLFLHYLKEPHALLPAGRFESPPRGRRNTLWIAVGIALAFLIGPALLLLALAR